MGAEVVPAHLFIGRGRGRGGVSPKKVCAGPRRNQRNWGRGWKVMAVPEAERILGLNARVIAGSNGDCAGFWEGFRIRVNGGRGENGRCGRRRRKEDDEVEASDFNRTVHTSGSEPVSDGVRSRWILIQRSR